MVPGLVDEGEGASAEALGPLLGHADASGVRRDDDDVVQLVGEAVADVVDEHGHGDEMIHRTRDITRPNIAVSNRVVGDVKGRDCVLVDDLIDTAGTIAGACRVLQEAGARSVTVVATHGVLSGPAVDRLKNSGAREVVLTDTVPIGPEKRWDGLTVLSIAPLLASAIKAVFEDGSVAELFDSYPEHHGQGFLFA